MPRLKRKSIPLPKYYIRLRDVRAALCIESTEMAQLGKASLTCYLGYEKNDIVEIPALFFQRLSLKLGLSVDYLLGLTDKPDSYPASEGPIFTDKINTSRVREFRLEHGITAIQMSELLDICQSAYSQKEVHPDKKRFSIIDLIRIAKFYHTSVDYLLGLTDKIRPHKSGCFGKVTLGIGQARKIKHKLGILKSPAGAGKNEKEYCKASFRLKSIRLSRQLTQQQVADAIGLERATYSVQERNPNRISVYHMIKLADFYHVSLDYLVGRSDVE